MSKKNESITMNPIGYAKVSEEYSYIEILKKYRPALKDLDQFSHLQVLWWANESDTEELKKRLQVEVPYSKPAPTVGVFATRAEYRPNPIALTTVPILSIDMKSGKIIIPYIDAKDGTPIVDLKGYFPICDRVRDAKYPSWLETWPEWYEDGAEFWAKIMEEFQFDCD